MPPSPSARPTTARASSAPPRSAASCSPACPTTRRRSRSTSATRSAGASRACCDRPVQVLGRFTQALPNNWKLYVENVKDTYHASLLHAFFGTFRITRLTQGGGVLVSPDGGAPRQLHHRPGRRPRRAPPIASRASARSSQGYRLADPSLLDTVDEFGDGIKLQILTVFPNFVAAADPQLPRRAPGPAQGARTRWSCTGPTSASPTTRPRCAAGASSRRTSSARPATCRWRTAASAASCSAASPPPADELSVVNMGGEGAESQETRATEASVRGFWKAYRRYMGY